MSGNPIGEFARTFDKAKKKESGDATACTLATATADGKPTARVVLLKSIDEQGFVFFTNYSSRKARELEENPHAALCFYWPAIEEQVRVEGRVEKITDAESDEYFASRSRSSRIGAWASKQSQRLTARTELLKRFVKYEARYAGKKVPRPPFWGGYRLHPERIEFWFNQPHRLHDRRAYTLVNEGWQMERLFP